jgi:hypothetical protein
VGSSSTSLSRGASYRTSGSSLAAVTPATRTSGFRDAVDLLKLEIPLSFVETQLGLPSWRVVSYGRDQELLDPRAPIDLALRRLEDEEATPALVELATAESQGPVSTYLEELAANEPHDEKDPAEVWLFLALAWLYHRREVLDDPLGAVEIAYADFDYPERIAHLVRYMPSDEPDLGSQELNEQRLYKRWSDFIEAERSRLISAR